MNSVPRRLLLVPLTALVTLLCIPARAHAQPTTNPHLTPLLWMIGDWDGAETGSTEDLIVHIHCTLSENRQALLYDVHFTKAGVRYPKYQGMYYWDPAEKTLRLQQISDEGNVGSGTYTAQDSTADQFVTVTTGTQTFDLKSHYIIHPTDFHFSAYFRASKDADWVPAVDVVYRRVR